MSFFSSAARARGCVVRLCSHCVSCPDASPAACARSFCLYCGSQTVLSSASNDASRWSAVSVAPEACCAPTAAADDPAPPNVAAVAMVAVVAVTAVLTVLAVQALQGPAAAGATTLPAALAAALAATFSRALPSPAVAALLPAATPLDGLAPLDGERLAAFASFAAFAAALAASLAAFSAALASNSASRPSSTMCSCGSHELNRAPQPRHLIRYSRVPLDPTRASRIRSTS